jgi:hypothetical protein
MQAMTNSARAAAKGPRALGRHVGGLLGAAALAAAMLAGCYDGDALRRQHAEAVSRVELEEIDLGAFTIALPHVLGDASDRIVDFHAFGSVATGDRDAIAQALQSRTAELRWRMLVTIRAMGAAKFAEPQLASLRRSIAEVINAAVGKELVKSVGFYSFTFTAT